MRGPSAAFSLKAKKARSWVAGARAGAIRCWSKALPDGHAIAYLPRAARHRRALRRRPAHRACLDPGGVAPHGADRQALQLGHDKVRVIAEHVGGGFGSKARLGAETIAAIELARAGEGAGPRRLRPPRGALRHRLSAGAEIEVSLLPSAQGDLKALSVTAYADTGAGDNSTIAGLARLIYPAEAKELVDYDVISNLPPGAPFRGPGGPPMAFALEQAIDEAALRMKVDPIALRKRWDPIPTAGGSMTGPPASTSGATGRQPGAQTGRYRRGVGVATGNWLYLWQPGVEVELAVEGGRLIASTATQDIGTGQPHRDRQYRGARIRTRAA